MTFKLLVGTSLTSIVCWLWLGAVSMQRSTAAEQPNIILILADDLGYGDLSCFGQQTLKTPRLDEMASQGMRLTQFYAGCTVCAPSRSVLMTGKHMGRTVVRGNSTAANRGSTGSAVSACAASTNALARDSICSA